MKNFELKSFSGADELARAAAQDWLDLLDRTDGAHLVAVPGGRIAKNFFRAVAELAGPSSGPLQKADFFWADERCVPPDHPQSNYLTAKDNLFDKMRIAPERIHRLKGELPAGEAVAEAVAAIRRLAPKNAGGVPVLDLIFLGLGEDGHVASLASNVPESVAQSASPFVHIENSPKPPPNRLSMTYPVLAAAQAVWVLASGAGKEEALRQSLAGATTPLGRVLQSRAQTRIYTDIAL
jgi:6-phosphogluconolactonase